MGHSILVYGSVCFQLPRCRKRRDDRVCSARISPLKNWHRGNSCLMHGVPLSATTVDENVQRRRAARPLSKIHGRKIIQKKLLGEIPAKDHGRHRNKIWQKGNNRDGNYGVRDSRELDEANKPSDAEDGVAGSERPPEATSTTAE